MRKLFLIIFLVPLLFACEQEEEGTRLTGTADNLESGFFILGGPGGSRDSVFIDENNSFSYEINELTEPTFYYFLVDNDFLRFSIGPDMEVDVYFDKVNFKESINFAGDGSDINNYLADKNRDPNIATPDREVFMLEAEAFKQWSDANLKAQLDLFTSQNKTDEENQFWKTEEADILFGHAELMSNYPMYHKYYAETEDVVLPEGFDSYKEGLDINNADYIKSTAFYSYVSGVVRELTTGKLEDNPEADLTLANLEVAKSAISNQKVLDNFMVTFMKDKMQWSPMNELTASIDYLKANCQDTAMLNDFNMEYESWLKLSEGQPAIDFMGKDLEGNEVKLSDFKGKYVYVDVWATWCGPCKYEIPFLKQLEADYHDRNIVFLSYSIDDDKQAWLDFVPENELKGVQIIGEAGWQSEMAVNYKIRGVPTFMLFGADGKIISTKMTRPSDEETRVKFDSFSDL